MCTEQQEKSRTPVTQEGRGGVWLEEGRFAEAGSFEWYLWLQGERMCHALLSQVINEVQMASYQERARLALDFPDVVAALEAPDWCKAPRRGTDSEGDAVDWMNGDTDPIGHLINSIAAWYAGHRADGHPECIACMPFREAIAAARRAHAGLLADLAAVRDENDALSAELERLREERKGERVVTFYGNGPVAGMEPGDYYLRRRVEETDHE